MKELIMTFKNEQISKDELMKKIEEVHFEEDRPFSFKNDAYQRPVQDHTSTTIRTYDTRKNEKPSLVIDEGLQRTEVEEKQRLLELK